MSGMTGYDQATSYPAAAQYNYVPNLQPDDPRHSSLGGVASGGWHHQYGGHQMQQQLHHHLHQRQVTCLPNQDQLLKQLLNNQQK